MSALETDLNPNTYIGLKLPIKKTSNLDFDMTKNSLEQSKFNISNLLLTSVGERVYQPEFGSRLRELIFEQIDDSLPEKVETEIKRVINFWLPYVNILSVETLTNDYDKNKIYVKIKYNTTLNTKTTQEVVIDTSNLETIT